LTLAGQLARLRETSHSPYTTLLDDRTCHQRAAHTRDQQFESTFLQRRVCKPSVLARDSGIAAWIAGFGTGYRNGARDAIKDKIVKAAPALDRE
jgi:hypothetical protein